MNPFDIHDLVSRLLQWDTDRIAALITGVILSGGIGWWLLRHLRAELKDAKEENRKLHDQFLKSDEACGQMLEGLIQKVTSMSAVGTNQLDIQGKRVAVEIQNAIQERKEEGANLEQEAVSRYPKGLKQTCEELRRRAQAFGPRVETYARRDRSISFRAGKCFADIVYQSRKSILLFCVRPEGFDIPEDQIAQVHGITVKRAPDAHGWSLNHSFAVDEKTDLDAVTKLLHQSYNAVAVK